MRLKKIKQGAEDSTPKVKEEMDFSFDEIHEDPVVKEEPFEEDYANFDTPKHETLSDINNFNSEIMKVEEISDDIKMHDNTVDEPSASIVKHEDYKFEDISACQPQIESASGIK